MVKASAKSHENVIFCPFFLHKIYEKGVFSTQIGPGGIDGFFEGEDKPLCGEKGAFFVQIAQKCPLRRRLTE